ncbi:unnamed protein product [Adineta steineri]|uniref:Elongation of very long chain fatty acids protein n=1 Tax=Adineta steineri TaxID=433720 RepID=A0A818U5C7_9BILA|nr:unnamed protein product [Adineta steineri]CAF3644907.1 unnamed protein product [Adineta steineri]CAF3693338.1 unnamed protein product [Adineta steineri]
MTWLNDLLIEHIPIYKHALKHADPRTKDWFLVWHDPIPTITLTLIYLAIVLYGPRYMKYREAFHISTTVLFTYNMALVLLSAYIVEEIFVGVYRCRYNLICQRMNISYDKNEMKITKILWFYYFSKAIEFLDTIFMIARKRFTQITFLHVFHHSSMLLLWWVVLTWVPSGQAWAGPFLNSIVHVIMYSYYALSAIPSLRDKLWWKRYITQFQLIQFVIVLSHTLGGIIYGCDYPLWGQLMLGGYMITMLFLFRNFYVHAYVTKKNESKRAKQN